MKFVSNRDVVVRSHGHAIGFEKGVPTDAPYIMREVLLEKGIIPVEDDGSPIDPVAHDIGKPVEIKLPPEDPKVRTEAIVQAMDAIVARNSSQDFTAGGVPRADSVSSAVGFKVTLAELRPIWEANRGRLKAA